MDDITSRALVSDPETRRALQLDTLSAILPMERRDVLLLLPVDDRRKLVGVHRVNVQRIKHAMTTVAEDRLESVAHA